VLDEADRMLDMGFINDVKKVIALLPKKRQTLLFSATMPDEISALANSILSNPAKVTVTPVASPVDIIDQSVYLVDKTSKSGLLIHLITEKAVDSALVFSRTKYGADRISKTLNKVGITAGAIHGDKSQGARQRALTEFMAGKTRVLVATDIAARGIDIDKLSYVFNYDLPEEAETYVHRIGRTGRAGHGGTAIAFCDFNEIAYLKAIEKLMGRQIRVEEDNPYPMQNFEPRKPQQPRVRKGSGRRNQNSGQKQSGQPKQSDRTSGFRKRGPK